MLCAIAALSFPSGGARAAAPIAVAVADFDYFDTSGEVVDQSAAHRARMASFATLLRDNLAAQGDYRVVRIECPDLLARQPACRRMFSSPPRARPARGWWSMAVSAR
ncbi:DUF2380 domain-containing protein [Bradyrhizobium archetypum]